MLGERIRSTQESYQTESGSAHKINNDTEIDVVSVDVGFRAAAERKSESRIRKTEAPMR